jgi:hypothetical protein
MRRTEHANLATFAGRDTSQARGSDRRLWLAEHCPNCGAEPGRRCHRRSLVPRTFAHTLALHTARGWRQRSCPTCHALPDQDCLTPAGRAAARPHTARLHPARDELPTLEDVWRTLEHAGAQLALVRFAGGQRRPGALESITINTEDHELARFYSADESELASALAAPIWARYASFRGHPRIQATLTWRVTERSLTLAGTRGSEHFHETLHARTPPHLPIARDTSRDTSPATASDDDRSRRIDNNQPHAAARTCCRCRHPIPASARPEARYCSKRCRQAASRARLRQQSGRPKPAEHCAWCEQPMPARLRPEARYCGKPCRQAASRARLALAPTPDARRTSTPPTATIRDTSRDTSPPTFFDGDPPTFFGGS